MKYQIKQYSSDDKMYDDNLVIRKFKYWISAYFYKFFIYGSWEAGPKFFVTWEIEKT